MAGRDGDPHGRGPLVDGVLTASYIVAVVIMGSVTHLYYERLAREGRMGLRPLSEISDEIQHHPARLLSIVSVETRLHLRALLTRQSDRGLERFRLAALGATALAVAVFLVILRGAVQRA